MALTDNIVAYYKLDETSGSVLDATGNGHNGTNNGATPNIAGKIGTAYSFDGSNDYISNLPSITTTIYQSAFTWNKWIKTTNHQSDTGLLMNGYSNRVLDAVVANGKYNVRADSGWPLNINSVSSINDGEWHMVTYSYSASSSPRVKLYVDGKLETTSNHLIEGIINEDMRIGNNAFNDGNGYNGSVDEVGIWSRALTSTEITELYNSGSGKTYPFVNQVQFTKNGISRIKKTFSFDKDADSRIKIVNTQITKEGKGLIYIGKISGQVTNQSVPVSGAKIIVMQSDDDAMTNLEIVSVETTDGSGNWSADITFGKVAWAVAYYKDGTDLYRSKAHGYLEVV